MLLTKDKDIRRRPLEIEAILNARVRAFVLTATELRREEQAAIFLRAMPKIHRICRRTGPFIFNVTRMGHFAELSKRVLAQRFSQGYLLYRRCARLSYTSQHQTAFKRAITRGQRLRAKLGAVTPGLTPFSQPPRPKRMWTRTYQRTLNQADLAELIADEHFYRRLCALTARVKRRPH